MTFNLTIKLPLFNQGVELCPQSAHSLHRNQNASLSPKRKLLLSGGFKVDYRILKMGHFLVLPQSIAASKIKDSPLKYYYTVTLLPPTLRLTLLPPTLRVPG